MRVLAIWLAFCHSNRKKLRHSYLSKAQFLAGSLGQECGLDHVICLIVIGENYAHPVKAVTRITSYLMPASDYPSCRQWIFVLTATVYLGINIHLLYLSPLAFTALGVSDPNFNVFEAIFIE